MIGTLDMEDAKFGDFKRPDVAGFFNCIGVEQVFDYGSSFQIMGGSFGFNNLLGFSVEGFSIMPEYRYYFKRNAPYGLYISPHMMYTQLKIGADIDFSVMDPILTNMKVETDLRFMAGGVTTGTQFRLFNKGFTDIYFGIQYRESVIAVEGTFDAANLPSEQAHIPDISKPFNIIAGLAFSYYLFD